MLNLDVYLYLLYIGYAMKLTSKDHFIIMCQRVTFQRLHSSNFEAFHKTIISRSEMNLFGHFVISGYWEYWACATNAFQRVVAQVSITL